ncbi:hypothetical protein U8527_01955 [Kordia algicida OT-1]|uniref:Uncharacterized protein n=1 Tax=Kordia algicida OT-1 TaxID=391587 RepID=A9DTF7_9FLAO|nr:hypothetical protein [Kordia algicida]EDP97067.1 hypothetical protein KAOT1_17928 [Kordia algicida OT-1]
MYNIEDFDVKSELIRKHWKFVNEVYGSLVEALKENELETEKSPLRVTLFDEIYDLMLFHWEKIYPEFVLHPKKDEILNMFHKAQTSDLHLNKPSKKTTKIYSVHYYVLQYFSLIIEPYHEYDFDKFGDLCLEETGDLNRLLHQIFDTIWYELKLTEKTGEDLFYDDSEFYDTEVALLTDFVSKCWNETKEKTKIDCVAVLSESTAADGICLLDEDKKLEDFDEISDF